MNKLKLKSMKSIRKLFFFVLFVQVCMLPLLAQQGSRVTGTVSDNFGDPLPGVNVVVKGTTTGVITDADGTYSITVPDNAVLVFTSIGYVSQEFEVGDQHAINISLQEDTKILEEVVVVGYGTIQRKFFTGSVSTVKVADQPVALAPRTNALDMLRGNVTGITVNREFEAGTTPNIEVHGQKSVNRVTSNPLFVVDGVIYPGGMQNIDPSNIESISVLKDASSLAAYGSQSANGVVMITMKKGKLGKPVVSFDVSSTFSGHIGIPKYQSPEDYVAARNIAYGVADAKSWMKVYTHENYDAGKVVDWIDEVTRTGFLQKYAGSVSGATERLNYFMSLSHNDQKGVVYGDDYKREALMLKLQSDITDWFQVGALVSYAYHNYDGVRAALHPWQSPFGNAYRPNGGVERYPIGESSTSPLWDTAKSGTRDNYERQSNVETRGHVLIKAPWITGLSYRLNAYYSNTIQHTYNFYNEGYYVFEGFANDDSRYAPETINGFLSRANGQKRIRNITTYVLDNILNYNASFGKHFIDVSAVYTRDYYKNELNDLNGSNFTSVGNTTLGYNGLAYAVTQTVGLSNTVKTNVGYLGRVNYSYNDRYNLTASIRRDGSSVFGDNNKWGVFPAVGVAWIISRENFMERFESINFLKLKVSWGKNGNQSLNPYGTLSTINTGQSGMHPYYFGNASEPTWGQFVTAIGNPTLGWEETAAWNAGFETGLLDNRINFELNIYKSSTTNQIFNRVIPPMSTGFTSTRATMGQVDNRGVEITLNTINMRKSNFEWSSMLNFYLNRNKLVDLYGDGKDDISNKLFLGKSLGAIYELKVAGIVQEGDTEYMNANARVPGDPKFYDQNGDGVITVSNTETDDRMIIGYSKENFQMNMSHTLRYGNWELYALFTGIFGGGGYGLAINQGAYNLTTVIEQMYNAWSHPWWTPENKSNTYTRPGANINNFNPVQSWTFVRFQDLTLSYLFRQKALHNLGVGNLRVYIAGKNLFVLTKWIGSDPEDHQNITGTGQPQYPMQRSVSVGLNLSF